MSKHKRRFSTKGIDVAMVRLKRKHHNNQALKGLQDDYCYLSLKRICRRLGLKYGKQIKGGTNA